MSLITPQARRLRKLIDLLVEAKVAAAFAGCQSPNDADLLRAGAALAEAKLDKFIEQLLERRT